MRPITTEERQLIQLLRQLDGDGRAEVSALAHQLLARAVRKPRRPARPAIDDRELLRLSKLPTSIEALEREGELTKRAYTALQNAGITNLRQLDGVPRYQMSWIPDVGKVTLTKIEALMIAHGLALDERGPRD
jgi:hypothetical protein